MMFVPPPQEGSTPAEKMVRTILLRDTLSLLPPEIATEHTLRRARIYQSGSCAVIAATCALLTWHATTLLGSGTGIILLVGSLGGWILASFPGLVLAALAFDGASKDEFSVILTLTTFNGSLVLLFFYVASHFAHH